MTTRKLNELDADIDDASTTVEELQSDPATDTTEKLSDLHDTLEHAKETIDDLEDAEDV